MSWCSILLKQPMIAFHERIPYTTNMLGKNEFLVQNCVDLGTLRQKYNWCFSPTRNSCPNHHSFGMQALFHTFVLLWDVITRYSIYTGILSIVLLFYAPKFLVGKNNVIKIDIFETSTQLAATLYPLLYCKLIKSFSSSSSERFNSNIIRNDTLSRCIRNTSSCSNSPVGVSVSAKASA